jgi:hypothetical protein
LKFGANVDHKYNYLLYVKHHLHSNIYKIGEGDNDVEIYLRNLNYWECLLFEEIYIINIFLISWDGVRRVHLVCRPLFGLLCQPRIADKYGAFGEMRIGRES